MEIICCYSTALVHTVRSLDICSLDLLLLDSSLLLNTLTGTGSLEHRSLALATRALDMCNTGTCHLYSTNSIKTIPTTPTTIPTPLTLTVQWRECVLLRILFIWHTLAYNYYRYSGCGACKIIYSTLSMCALYTHTYCTMHSYHGYIVLKTCALYDIVRSKHI